MRRSLKQDGALLTPPVVPWRSSQPSMPRPLNVLGIGLSLMAPNAPSPPGPAGYHNPAGYLNWANYLLGQKLNLYGIFGMPGATSGPITDTNSVLYGISTPGNANYALALNPPPDVVFMQIDTGDDVLPADPNGKQYVQQIYDVVMRAYPNAMYWGMTLPGVLIGGNAARRAVINPWLRSFLQDRNVRLLDYEAITTDQSTGLPLAGESIDSIHPNAAGALRIGRYIARELGPFVAQGSTLIPDVANDTRVQSAQGGWGTDAMMLATGTGGRNGTTGLNDLGIASNWQMFSPVPTGSVFSLIPRADGRGNWQRMQMPPGSAAGQLALGKLTPVLPAGAQFYLECETRTHGDWDTPTDFGLVFGFSSVVNTMDLTSAGTNHGPPADPGRGVRGVLRTATITVPTGGITAGFAYVYFAANAGTLDVSRFSFVRVA